MLHNQHVIDKLLHLHDVYSNSSWTTDEQFEEIENKLMVEQNLSQSDWDDLKEMEKEAIAVTSLFYQDELEI